MFDPNNYIPKTLDDMVIEPHVKEVLQAFEQGTLHNLILWGSPGAGKTTIADILTNQKILKCRVKKVACGLKRGVAYMEGEILQFVRSYAEVPKIIILDEFGNEDGTSGTVSKAAMQTAKSVFEEARQSNTYFIITSNGIHKIPDAIKSRCLTFEFKELPRRASTKYAMEILEKEGIDYERKDVSEAVNKCYPDFRSLLNLLSHSSVSGTLKLRDVDKFEFDFNKLEEFIIAGKPMEAYDKVISRHESFGEMYHWLVDFSRDFDEQSQAEMGVCICHWACNDAQKQVDPRMAAYGCLCETINIVRGKKR